MKQFAIHESNLERLQKKITRIRTKCEKYGCDFYYAEVREEFRTFNEGEDDEYTARYVIVECEGTAIVNGWRFVATIDHTDAGNIIRQLIDEVEVPERYRTADPECEHCHSKRHRKDTYIVYNEETQEFKQVGSSCLCDFTGGFSAEAAASYISLFDSLIEGEAFVGGCNIEHWYDRDEMLRYAYLYVKHLGYKNSDSWDTSTKQMTYDGYCYDNNRRRLDKYQIEAVEEYRETYHPNYDSDEVTQYVEAMLDYIRNWDESSSYANNLKVLANSDYLTYKNLGYLVSMVAVYNRYLRKEEYKRKVREQNDKEASTSEYIGQAGDRVEFTPVDIVAITSWANQFGSVTRYKFTDDNGNVIMWDCSTHVDQDKEVASIKGTVKKLDIWNGVKQTWLTRCKVTYVENKHADGPKKDGVKEAMDEFYNFVEDDKECRSATAGDYSPSSPWNAPGMSTKDFI